MATAHQCSAFVKMADDQYRSVEGKFGIKIRDESKKRKLETMRQARKKLKVNEEKNNDEVSSNSILDGCRIVDLKEFARTSKCTWCSELLDLGTSNKEKRSGFSSSFSVVCKKCHKWNSISTGKVHQHSDKEYFDINSSAVLGNL